MITRRSILAILSLIVAVAVLPLSVRADEAKPVANEAASSAADEGMGCPGKRNGGSCCASCQDKQKVGAAAGAANECPCQRAKRLRDKAKQGS
jgi:hypothetical protein